MIFWWVQLFYSTVVVRIPNLAFCHSFTVSLRIEKKIHFSHPPTDIVFWGGEAKQKKKLFKSSLKSQLRNYNSTHVKECKASFAFYGDFELGPTCILSMLHNQSWERFGFSADPNLEILRFKIIIFFICITRGRALAN